MKMNVKPINLTEDKPVLLQLWSTAFPEDQAFAELFLQEAMPPVTGWVCRVEDQPVSMAYLLPATLQIGGETCKAQYVYAVATLPEYRGLGCASTLLRTVAEQTDADILYLYPATPKAGKLYQRLGYRDILRRKTVGFQAISPGKPLKTLSFYPFSAEKYAELREKYQPYTAFCRADFPEKLLNVLLNNATLLEWEDGFVLMQEDENTCVLSEVVTSEDNVPLLLSSVQQVRPDKPVLARLPGGEEGAGMLLPLTDKARALTDTLNAIPFGGPLFDL